MKHLLFLVLLIAATTFCFLAYDVKGLKPIYDISLILIGISIGHFVPLMKQSWLHITTSINGNKKLRASFSYLIRISIKDKNQITKFLLVKSNKIEGFQPPGGVYKYYDSSFLNNFSAQDHPLLHRVNNLSLLIKRKKYPKILNWFESNSGRECTPERKFYKELIETKILDINLFPFGKFSYAQKHRTPIEFSTHLGTDEIKYFDVYDLLLTKDQEVYLKHLSEKDSDMFKFASDEDIRRLGFSPSENKDEYRILEQTIFLTNKYTK